MKKTTFLLHSFYEQNFGGAEYQAYLLADELIRNNYQVDYIYIDNGKVFKKTPVMHHCLEQRTVSRKFGQNRFLYSKQIFQILNEIQPDIIYHRNVSAFAGIAAKYCVKSDCKMIWHIASEPDVQPFRLKKVRTAIFDFIDKKFAEYGVRHADKIIGQAKYQEELLLKNYGRKCDLIIGNWHPLPKEECSKALPLKVVWVANIKPLKQPEMFIKLAEKLRDIKNVEFIMIGRPASGKYQKRLEERIDKVDNLTYLGEMPNDEVNQLLLKSHIFVNTSKFEGFSNTFIQAWMREVPVISLSVDPDDILKKEQIGFHSESFNALIQDTKRLIENRKLLSQMGKRAREYSIANHSMEKNMKLLMRLF